MKKVFISLFFLIFLTTTYAQNSALNKVTLLYKQSNYRLTYWRADELFNQPELDSSLIPEFYKSLSLFHLQDKFLFRKRDKQPWIEASEIFKQIKTQPKSKHFLLTHKDEISDLRDYLIDELNWFKTKNDIKKAALLTKAIEGIFDGLKLNPIKSKHEKINVIEVPTKQKSLIEPQRENLIEYAEKCIGIPYLFGGDSLDGFDCSGFTGYVFTNSNFKVGRSSRDQYQSCKKINKDEVKPGDLIFFNSGKDEVTHVGIVVSKQGEPLKMIHSSTSKGVIVSEVETSEYWMNKITGFGTFFE